MIGADPSPPGPAGDRNGPCEEMMDLLKLIFASAALMLLAGLPAPASAHGFGGFGGLDVCSADDPGCQLPGTVALACLGSAQILGDTSLWRSTGDALRVHNGRWQMFHASSGQHHPCAQVLVQRGGGWGTGMRLCAGNDPGCQRPGEVAYSCFLESAAAGQPTRYAYTGDAIRVSGGHWQIWYSHNQQSYRCAAVLVGPVPHGFGPVRLCAGNDPACQAPGTVPLLCDIRGDGFASPASYAYTGRAMRVAGGQWRMLYPDESQYVCRQVIVATPAAVPPSPPAPAQPVPPAQAALPPSGSVIVYDGHQCPAGWLRLGDAPGFGPTAGMSYCRRL